MYIYIYMYIYSGGGHGIRTTGAAGCLLHRSQETAQILSRGIAAFPILELDPGALKYRSM